MKEADRKPVNLQLAQRNLIFAAIRTPL